MKKFLDIDIEGIFSPLKDNFPPSASAEKFQLAKYEFEIDPTFNYLNMVEEDTLISLKDIEKDKGAFCFSHNKKVYVVYKKDNCGRIRDFKSHPNYNPDRPTPPYVFNKIHLKYCANIEEHAELKAGLVKTFRINAQKKFPVLIETNPQVEISHSLSVCQTCLEEMSSILQYIGVPLLTYRSKTDGLEHWDGINFNLALYAKKMAEHPELLLDQSKMESLHGDQMNVGYNIGSHIAIKRALIKRYGYVCAKCHVDLTYTPRLLSLHHKNRKKYENTFENCELLCALCHFEEEHGGAIPQGEKDFILNERTKIKDVPAPKRDIIVEDELKKALSLKSDGLYNEALLVYLGIDEALCSVEELINLHYALGQLYYILDNYPEALQRYLSVVHFQIEQDTPDLDTYAHLGYAVFAYLKSKGDTSNLLNEYFPSEKDYRATIDPHFGQTHSTQKPTLTQHGYAIILAFETTQIMNNIFGVETIAHADVQNVLTDFREELQMIGHDFFSMEVAQIITFARIWKKKFLIVNDRYRQNTVMDFFPEEYFTGYALYLGISIQDFFADDGMIDDTEDKEIQIRSLLSFRVINTVAMGSYNDSRARDIIVDNYVEPDNMQTVLNNITHYSRNISSFCSSDSEKEWMTAYGIMMYFSATYLDELKKDKHLSEEEIRDKYLNNIGIHAILGYKAFICLKSTNYSIAKALNKAQGQDNEGLVSAIKVLKGYKDTFLQEIKAHTI